MEVNATALKHKTKPKSKPIVCQVKICENMTPLFFRLARQKNAGDAQASARIFNAARWKKSKSEFTNFGLSNYKKTKNHKP